MDDEKLYALVVMTRGSISTRLDYFFELVSFHRIRAIASGCTPGTELEQEPFRVWAFGSREDQLKIFFRERREMQSIFRTYRFAVATVVAPIGLDYPDYFRIFCEYVTRAGLDTEPAHLTAFRIYHDLIHVELPPLHELPRFYLLPPIRDCVVMRHAREGGHPGGRALNNDTIL